MEDLEARLFFSAEAISAVYTCFWLLSISDLMLFYFKRPRVLLI